MDGVAGWRCGVGKVGIHDLFEFLLPDEQPLKPPGMAFAEQAFDSYVVMTNHHYLKILTASREKPIASLPTRSRSETKLILNVSREESLGSLPTRPRPKGNPDGLLGRNHIRPTPNESFCYVFERRAHAPLPAGENVDHGVDVGNTGDHRNRAAGRGCHGASCSVILSYALPTVEVRENRLNRRPGP